MRARVQQISPQFELLHQNFIRHILESVIIVRELFTHDLSKAVESLQCMSAAYTFWRSHLYMTPPNIKVKNLPDLHSHFFDISYLGVECLVRGIVVPIINTSRENFEGLKLSCKYE